MIRILKNILFITVPMFILIFIILEVFFRFGLQASQAPSSYFDESSKILKFDQSKKSGTSTFSKFCHLGGKWEINKAGWNAPFEYKEERTDAKRIVVIGDSYVQAFQVDNDKNFHQLLNQNLGPKYEVYGMGISGAPLSQYLNVARYAREKYNPDIFIFNLIHNDFDESLTHLPRADRKFLTYKIEDNLLIEVPAYKPPLSIANKIYRNVLKKSAIFRYLWININIPQLMARRKIESKSVKDKPQKNYRSNIAVSTITDNFSDIEKLVPKVMRSLKAECTNREMLFVIDAPREAIYENKKINEDPVYILNNLVKEVSDSLQINFLDLSTAFEKDYTLNGTRFEADYDWHWNQKGHQVVADAIYNYLTKEKL